MTKRKIIWTIAVLVMGVLVVLYMVKMCKGRPRLSEFDVERQYFRDMSVSVTGAPILSLQRNEINLTQANSIQNHLQVDHQPELSNGSKNIAYLQACASEWLKNNITVQDMLHCVEGDAGRKNGSQED
ncbi:MAG: hypothetical protein ACYS30_18390 [Planctomycetota bacterium]